MIKISEIRALFDKWNTIKKKIHIYKNPKKYNEREVWWCSFGQNIGDEHNGVGDGFQRPVLIVRGFSVSTCAVLPLTTSTVEHKYRIKIGNVAGKDASVILSQITVIDTRRLVDKSIHTVGKELFEEIKKRIRNLF